jgi:hypothetical protein
MLAFQYAFIGRVKKKSCLCLLPSQSLVLSHTYTVLQPDVTVRLEGIIDQIGQYIPTGLSMISHTLLKQKILTGGFKSHLHAITCIWYHKKNCTYYIHKLGTLNKSAFLSMNIFIQANSFATPYFPQVPCLLYARNFIGVLSSL